MGDQKLDAVEEAYMGQPSVDAIEVGWQDKLTGLPSRPGRDGISEEMTEYIWQTSRMAKRLHVDLLFDRKVSTPGGRMGRPHAKGFAKQLRRPIAMDDRLRGIAAAQCEKLRAVGREQPAEDCETFDVNIVKSEEPLAAEALRTKLGGAYGEKTLTAACVDIPEGEWEIWRQRRADGRALLESFERYSEKYARDVFSRAWQLFPSCICRLSDTEGESGREHARTNNFQSNG